MKNNDEIMEEYIKKFVGKPDNPLTGLTFAEIKKLALANYKKGKK